MARVSISVPDEIVARAKGAQLNISSVLGEWPSPQPRSSRVAIWSGECLDHLGLTLLPRPEVVEPIHVLVALA